MIDANEKKKAKQNFGQYLQDGLIKKERNETARAMYLKNAEQSLDLAEECMNSRLRPYLWVVVISYYSMFYIANAVLLQLGYKTGSKVVHKVTSDALVVLVIDKIRKGLLEEYEDVKEDALEIASIKSEEIISFYSMEMDKRSRFQYNMTETIQEQKAGTSLKRAREFTLEVNLPIHRKRWGIASKLSINSPTMGAWASRPETFGWFTAACRSSSMG